MQVDAADYPQKQLEQLLTSLVIPRPIGWVSTVDQEGRRNVAPFSAFNHVSHAPPILMVSFSQRGGRPKDTLVNIEATRQFVVNLVSENLIEQMNLTSGNYPPEVDEFEVAQLTPAPSVRVKPPRVAESPVNMECVLLQTVALPGSTNVVAFGQVVYFHVADHVLNEKGTADPQKLRPLARLGGKGWYTRLGEIFQVQRPP